LKHSKRHVQSALLLLIGGRQPPRVPADFRENAPGLAHDPDGWRLRKRQV